MHYDLQKAFDKSSVESKKAMAIISKMSSRFDATEIFPNEAKYQDAMQGFDGRESIAKAINAIVAKNGVNLDLTKAQSVSGLSAGTADVSLIPIYVDPVIVDLTRRLTPLVELIPRVTNYGKTADYNQVTARGVVGFRTEDASLDEANDTYARRSTGIKYHYEVGRVTGPMLAASRQYLSNQYIDALNLEVRQKTVTFRYVEEDALLNGDATATRTAYGGAASGGDASNYAAEFSGFHKLVTTNSNAPISGANTDVSIADLRKAVRLARTAGESTTLGQGDPNLMVTDFSNVDKIKGLLQQYQRYVNTNFEIAWGLKTLEFEGLPIVPSKFEPVGSSNVRKLGVWSTDTWQMRVLQDVTYEELAKQNDSYKFMLKAYESAICTAEQFNAQIVTISD